MANLNTFVPGKKEGTIKTAKCRLLYPSLFTPVNMKGQANDVDESKLKYRLTLLVPKKSNIDFLKESVDAIIAEQAKKDQDIARRPYIKVADQNSLSKYADEYPIMLRVTSKYPPDVVGPALNKVEESDAYSGRWGIAVLNPYWYDSIDGGKPGVALGLNSVQLLDHADPIGGSRVAAEDEFEAVDVDGDDETASMEDMLA